MSLVETERVFALADPAATAWRPAVAVCGDQLPKADRVWGGVGVEELFALADISEGEEAHALHHRLPLAGGHLSGREARTRRTRGVSLPTKQNRESKIAPGSSSKTFTTWRYLHRHKENKQCQTNRGENSSEFSKTRRVTLTTRISTKLYINMRGPTPTDREHGIGTPSRTSP